MPSSSTPTSHHWALTSSNMSCRESPLTDHRSISAWVGAPASREARDHGREDRSLGSGRGCRVGRMRRKRRPPLVLYIIPIIGHCNTWRAPRSTLLGSLNGNSQVKGDGQECPSCMNLHEPTPRARSKVSGQECPHHTDNNKSKNKQWWGKFSASSASVVLVPSRCTLTSTTRRGSRLSSQFFCLLRRCVPNS